MVNPAPFDVQMENGGENDLGREVPNAAVVNLLARRRLDIAIRCTGRNQDDHGRTNLPATG